MSRDSMPGFVDGVVIEAAYMGSPGYYIVRGYRHPAGLVLVESYKTPTCRGIPLAPREYIPCLGLESHVVERGRVIRVVSTGRSLESLPLGVRSVIRDFLDSLGVEWSSITGSYAVHCERRESDVDVIALYERGVYAALRDLRREGLITQCKEGHVVEKRSRGPGGAALDPARIAGSLTDSCYKGVPYTLRLITSLSDAECIEHLDPMGPVEVVLHLEPIGEPVTVPSRYMGRVIQALQGPLAAGDIVIVESWRTRYQELTPGQYRVRGLLRLDSRGGYNLTPDHGGVIEREPSLISDPY